MARPCNISHETHRIKAKKTGTQLTSNTLRFKCTYVSQFVGLLGCAFSLISGIAESKYNRLFAVRRHVTNKLISECSSNSSRAYKILFIFKLSQAKRMRTSTITNMLITTLTNGSSRFNFTTHILQLGNVLVLLSKVLLVLSDTTARSVLHTTHRDYQHVMYFTLLAAHYNITELKSTEKDYVRIVSRPLESTIQMRSLASCKDTPSSVIAITSRLAMPIDACNSTQSHFLPINTRLRD
jgi:hypothetical protein